MEGVRLANEADLARLVELVTEGVEELRPMRGGDVWAAARPRDDDAAVLAGALRADDQLVLVGTIDDVVLGYAHVRVDRLPDGRRLGVVDGLYVEPEARGVGVGEGLAEALVEWCRARECTGIDAVALPGHRETKNFFEAAGFTARLLIMHKRLDP